MLWVHVRCSNGRWITLPTIEFLLSISGSKLPKNSIKHAPNKNIGIVYIKPFDTSKLIFSGKNTFNKAVLSRELADNPPFTIVAIVIVLAVTTAKLTMTWFLPIIHIASLRKIFIFEKYNIKKTKKSIYNKKQTIQK